MSDGVSFHGEQAAGVAVGSSRITRGRSGRGSFSVKAEGVDWESRGRGCIGVRRSGAAFADEDLVWRRFRLAHAGKWRRVAALQCIDYFA